MGQRPRGREGLGLVDGLLVGVIAAGGLLTALFFLSFLDGLVWELVKIALVVAVVLVLLWAVLGRRR